MKIREAYTNHALHLCNNIDDTYVYCGIKHFQSFDSDLDVLSIPLFEIHTVQNDPIRRNRSFCKKCVQEAENSNKNELFQEQLLKLYG